jgi:hypothetical protein
VCWVAASLLGDGRATDEALVGLGPIEDCILGVQTMLELDLSGSGGCPVLPERPAPFKVGAQASSFLFGAGILPGRGGRFRDLSKPLVANIGRR